MRVAIAGLVPGERELDAAVARYVIRVLRLRAGDAFVAFDPHASSPVEADVAIVRTRDEALVVVTVGALRPAAVVAPRGLTLVQGLAKGEKVDAIVRDATELGATRVTVAACARSVVKLDDPARAGAKLERWRKIATEAARQAGRGDPPSIELATWGEALASARARGEHGFCLWERATGALGPSLAAALADEGPLAVAVGPEGGLTDDEAEAAHSAGFALVSLGPLVLRTETVCAAVLGAVRAWS